MFFPPNGQVERQPYLASSERVQSLPEFTSLGKTWGLRPGRYHESHGRIHGAGIWQCVKTLYPCSSHQNSWDSWMFIPLKIVLIGIDPYPSYPYANINGVYWWYINVYHIWQQHGILWVWWKNNFSHALTHKDTGWYRNIPWYINRISTIYQHFKTLSQKSG